MSPLFVLTVVVPTVIAVLYFGLIASDVYISESRFIIRTPEKPSYSGLSSLLVKSSGGDSADGDVDAVVDFARSRDALAALNQSDWLRDAYSNSKIDFIDRFGGVGGGHSFERLFKYYQRKVTLQHDSNSENTVLTVHAYTAQDAYAINQKLLSLSEALVNRLNERSQQNTIRYAAREVAEAEAVDRAAALALSRYRDRTQLIDPEKQAEVNVQLISKLQDELISGKAELAELQFAAPKSPQIGVLGQRIASLQQQIQDQTTKNAGDTGSLAGAAAAYEGLQLESQFADKELASAMASLDEARNEARRQQVYLETVVQPNVPDKAMEPKRLRDIFTTVLLGFVAWGILSMLLAGVKEHQV